MAKNKVKQGSGRFNKEFRFPLETIHGRNYASPVFVVLIRNAVFLHRGYATALVEVGTAGKALLRAARSSATLPSLRRRAKTTPPELNTSPPERQCHNGHIGICCGSLTYDVSVLCMTLATVGYQMTHW
jgi:hypothetical protein